MPNAPKQHRPHGQANTPRREYDQRRGSASARGYDRWWVEASAMFIAQQFAKGNNRCALCGKMLFGERRNIHVDHIKPHSGKADPLYRDVANWQMTHPECHSRKTGHERGGK